MAVGWWPPDIQFDVKDLNTVAKVMEEQAKQRGKR